MTISIDWKFWVALTATVAGVIVPVWLWRFDLTSRELTISVSSKTALSPILPNKTTDLEISLAGRALADPYSAVIEISNTGSKPILAAEIEGTIDLEVTGGSKLVQAQFLESRPKALSPLMTSTGQRVSIQPLLLNPGDSIKVAVLTESGSPTFLPRARIAGISEPVMLESNQKSVPPAKRLGAYVAPFAIASVLMMLFMQRFPDRTFHFGAVVTAALGTVTCAAASAIPIWNEYFGNSVVSGLAFSTSLTFTGAAFAMIFLRHRQRTSIAR